MSNNNYVIIQIDDHSWRIEDDKVRMFLFEGADTALLIDTGFGSGNLRAEIEKLTNKPILLVNTHADPDHTGCNHQFEQVYMHPSENINYNSKQPIAPAKPLWEGDNIDIGGRCFEVILLPGHTPGSIALLDSKSKLLISGDTVAKSPIFCFGAMRNIDAYIESLNKLLGMKDLFDDIYPSHGEIPLNSDIIPNLIEGATKLKNGELTGVKTPIEIPALLYESNGVAFFAD